MDQGTIKMRLSKIAIAIFSAHITTVFGTVSTYFYHDSDCQDFIEHVSEPNNVECQALFSTQSTRAYAESPCTCKLTVALTLPWGKLVNLINAVTYYSDLNCNDDATTFEPGTCVNSASSFSIEC
jgi:hypothetical protein